MLWVVEGCASALSRVVLCVQALTLRRNLLKAQAEWQLCACCRPALQKAFQKQIDDMYKKQKSR